MKIKVAFLLVFVFGIQLNLFGQATNSFEKLWSPSSKLNINDFKLDVEAPSNVPCFAQFSINYSVSGFDFLSRNFNQKVRNVMHMNASWINAETGETERLLQFQQILFNLSELYARKFRKELLINRKQISKGTQIIEEIHNEITKRLTTEWAKFQNESNSGQLIEVMNDWEKRVDLELLELDIFSYENTNKIKLEK